MSKLRRLSKDSRRRTLWIDDELWDRARAKAMRDDRSVSALVRQVLKRALAG